MVTGLTEEEKMFFRELVKTYRQEGAVGDALERGVISKQEFARIRKQLKADRRLLRLTREGWL